MKKQNRLLIGIGIIAALCVSWYTLFNNASEINDEYNQNVSEAQRLASLKIYTESSDYYQKAYEIRPSVDLAIEYASMLKESEDSDAYVWWIKKAGEDYPDSPELYELLGKFYYEEQNFDDLVEMIKTVDHKEITSEELTSLKNTIKKQYSVEENLDVMEVRGVVNNLCAVKYDNGKWGYIDRNGNKCVSGVFMTASAFSADHLALVSTENDEYILVDEQGNRKGADPEKKKNIVEGRRFSNGYIGAKIGDKYVFLDKNYKESFGKYDDIVPFSSGYAGVKEGAKWYIIDTLGQKVSEKGYDGIITNDDEIAFVNERCFVLDGGKVIMINLQGETIGSEVYEDAFPFLGNGYAAVKIGGKWGFVDADGKVVIEPQYENARSFSNGRAAVCKGGLWGYIDTSGEVITECQFTEARDLTDALTAFVKDGDRWIVIKYYM